LRKPIHKNQPGKFKRRGVKNTYSLTCDSDCLENGSFIPKKQSRKKKKTILRQEERRSLSIAGREPPSTCGFAETWPWTGEQISEA